MSDFNEFRNSMITISLSEDDMKIDPKMPKIRYIDDNGEVMAIWNFNNSDYDYQSENFTPYDKKWFEKQISDNKEKYLKLWAKCIRDTNL